MKEPSCLDCKYVSYVIVNLKSMNKSIFYCMKNEEIYMNTDPCSNYQKKSNE